jgi:CDP-2,3-bis-(O-geranylgeranyl)-sn-glycerol synthase
MPDGERLFGKSQDVARSGEQHHCVRSARPLASDLPAWLGAGFAALSLTADACSSAVKRRMRLKPGSEVLGLDQLAEALVPLLVFSWPLGLQAGEITFVTAAFVILRRGNSRTATSSLAVTRD